MPVALLAVPSVVLLVVDCAFSVTPLVLAEPEDASEEDACVVPHDVRPASAAAPLAKAAELTNDRLVM